MEVYESKEQIIGSTDSSAVYVVRPTWMPNGIVVNGPKIHAYLRSTLLILW